MLTAADDYRKMAMDCRTEAEHATALDAREAWLNLAAQWRHLSDKADADRGASEAIELT